MLTLKMVFRDPTCLRKYYKGRIEFPREPLQEANVTLACIKFHETLLQPSPRDRPSSKDAISQEWMQIPINSPNNAEANVYQQDEEGWSGTSLTITPPAIVRHEPIPYRTTGSSSSKDRYVLRQADDEADNVVSATYAPTRSSGSVADAINTREPSVTRAPPVRGVWSIYCNNCDAILYDAHYHCSICDDNDSDLCEACIASDTLCPGNCHELIKRCIKDGKVVTSNDR